MGMVGQADFPAHELRRPALASLAIASAAGCCLPGTFAARDKNRRLWAHQPEWSRLFFPPGFPHDYEAGAQPGGVEREAPPARLLTSTRWWVLVRLTMVVLR